MKARKIVLLSLIAVLLCVYIIQLVSITAGSVKQVGMTGEPDRIVLESLKNGKIVISKKDEKWYLGENQQYDVLESEVNILIEALRSYSILQTVSKGGDEVLYGLDDDAKITVSAWQDGNLLTQIDVGKDGVSRQSYIRMAGESDIQLISDSFNQVFNVTQDDVRVRTVYSFLADEITDAAVVSNEAGAVMMSRAENGEWVGSYLQMTSEGIASWISSISMLNASGWLPDDWQPTGEPYGLITFRTENEIVQNAIYKVEGEEDRYIGTSSVCPYAFYISAYTAGKFLRTADDFAE